MIPDKKSQLMLVLSWAGKLGADERASKKRERRRREILLSEARWGRDWGECFVMDAAC